MDKIKELTIQKILDSTYDGISAVNKFGEVVLFNSAAKRIFKLEEKDYTGELIEKITPNPKMPQILQTQEGDVNAVVDISDELTVVTSRSPIFDENNNIIGAVAVFKDVPQLQYLSTEVSRLEEVHCMMQAIFHAAQDAISVANHDGKIVMINKAYERLLGCDQSEIMGKSCEEDVIYGQSVHKAVLDNCKEQKGCHLRIGKEMKEVIADGAPILVEGKLAGSVVVARDLTEIKALAKELERTKKALREISGKYTFNDILGKDRDFVRIVENARTAAKTKATILLEGESGTGKEIFAHAIHNESHRAHQPFLRVNCAAISESLLESELFGYEEGAFTGALKKGKAGYFERADGGTLFLDEVSKMSLSLQSKLLRVLQEKELMRVGSTKTINVDVRIIAATNIDLEEEIRNNNFREDLFYRLNMVPIKIPPLRKRRSDIPILAEHMLMQFNIEYGRQIRGMSKDVLEILKKRYWKGNIRELKNYIGRAIIYMEKEELYLEEKHLPEYFDIYETEHGKANSKEMGSELDSNLVRTLDEVVSEVEKKYIVRILSKNQGNRTKTAKELGISIRSFYYKLKSLKIE